MGELILQAILFGGLVYLIIMFNKSDTTKDHKR